MGDPMDLVSHVNRSKSGMTKMQVQLSIEMRAGMAEASKRLGMSQLALIRSAISAFLLAHGGTATPPVPPSEAPGPVVEPIPVSPTSGSQENEPEQAPAIESGEDTILESVVQETIMVPEQTPAPKQSRRKKGKASNV